ncbi:hypothetical protein MRB53_023871 [Persea americana]|uniref:Uncharacterized protein n=1 Tax=Persea americana TaxID=3435 RepID=A0ACC2LB53_PERAE|nr:hypothetical protein MRB53_023871 [Persea americana]
MEYMPSRSEAELSSSGEDHLKDEFADTAGQGRHRHRSVVTCLLRVVALHQPHDVCEARWWAQRQRKG